MDFWIVRTMVFPMSILRSIHFTSIKAGFVSTHNFLEKAFHGSFKEATNESIYLQEDDVDEVILFEQWLYSRNFSYPKDSDGSSLLLVKVLCFADKVGILSLQNAILDAIRDQLEEYHVTLLSQNIP